MSVHVAGHVSYSPTLLLVCIAALVPLRCVGLAKCEGDALASAVGGLCRLLEVPTGPLGCGRYSSVAGLATCSARKCLAAAPREARTSQRHNCCYAYQQKGRRIRHMTSAMHCQPMDSRPSLPNMSHQRVGSLHSPCALQSPFLVEAGSCCAEVGIRP